MKVKNTPAYYGTELHSRYRYRFLDVTANIRLGWK
jgi:hypothetical protein